VQDETHGGAERISIIGFARLNRPITHDWIVCKAQTFWERVHNKLLIIKIDFK